MYTGATVNRPATGADTKNGSESDTADATCVGTEFAPEFPDPAHTRPIQHRPAESVSHSTSSYGR